MLSGFVLPVVRPSARQDDADQPQCIEFGGALVGNAQQGERYYRITVALERQNITAYGKSEALKPGTLLDADVLGRK